MNTPNRVSLISVLRIAAVKVAMAAIIGAARAGGTIPE